MDPELLSWLITQLEEELDATENKIIANNIGLIASFKVETYNIDAGLINIITLAVNSKKASEIFNSFLFNLNLNFRKI